MAASLLWKVKQIRRLVSALRVATSEARTLAEQFAKDGQISGDPAGLIEDIGYGSIDLDCDLDGYEGYLDDLTSAALRFTPKKEGSP